MSFRKNLYFSCKHCGRDSYIDDTKFAFDDFGNGNLNGNQTEIALKCDFCQKFNCFKIEARLVEKSSFENALNKDIERKV